MVTGKRAGLSGRPNAQQALTDVTLLESQMTSTLASTAGTAIGAGGGSSSWPGTGACDTEHVSLAPFMRSDVELGPVAESEAAQSLNALISASMRYNSSRDYLELLTFMRKFHWYAPFNALLVHIQRPGATYVATARRWEEYGRRVLPEAQVLMLLQPFGPVMFAFDVAQTAALSGASALPAQVLDPYVTRSALSEAQADAFWALVVGNAVRDGVRVARADHAPGSAGSIRTAGRAGSQSYVTRVKPREETAQVPIRYELVVNAGQKGASALATLVHELAHLYCGHLGTPDAKWWPDRRGVSELASEFEAESVAAVVLQRWDPTVKLPPHLAQYLRESPTLPEEVSLERIVKAAEEVLSMGRQPRLKVRQAGKRRHDR